MRVALYGRVSTTDKGQDAENQMLLLRKWAADQGWQVVAEYVDQASGKTAKRSEFQKMFAAAEQKSFDMLLFYALDRITREGVLRTFEHLEQLKRFGVQWKSLQERWLEADGPVGEVLIALMAWAAKQERQRISERTKAGLARAVAAGKKLGAPRTVNPFDVLRMRRKTSSHRQCAIRLGVSLKTVSKILGPSLVERVPDPEAKFIRRNMPRFGPQSPFSYYNHRFSAEEAQRVKEIIEAKKEVKRAARRERYARVSATMKATLAAKKAMREMTGT